MARDVVFVAVAIALMFAVALIALAQSARSERIAPKLTLRAVTIISIVFLLGLVQEMGLRITAQQASSSPWRSYVLGPGQLAFSLAAMGAAAYHVVVRRRHRIAILAEVGLAEALGSTEARSVRVEECSLTRREMDVLDAMHEGALTDVELADALFISKSTAGTHVRNILRKTELHDRADLLLLSRGRFR